MLSASRGVIGDGSMPSNLSGLGALVRDKSIFFGGLIMIGRLIILGASFRVEETICKSGCLLGAPMTPVGFSVIF